MSKIPRDVDAVKFLKHLKRAFGYEVTRQKGSHLRIERLSHPIHRMTIPNHDPIVIGTLTDILNELEEVHGIKREALLKLLFD